MNVANFISGSIRSESINWSKPLDQRTGNNFLKLCSLHNIPCRVASFDGGQDRLLMGNEIVNRLKHIISSTQLIDKDELDSSGDLYNLDFIMDFVWLVIYWQNGYSKGFKLLRTAAFKKLFYSYKEIAAVLGILILSIGALLLVIRMM